MPSGGFMLTWGLFFDSGKLRLRSWKGLVPALRRGAEPWKDVTGYSPTEKYSCYTKLFTVELNSHEKNAFVPGTNFFNDDFFCSRAENFW